MIKHLIVISAVIALGGATLVAQSPTPSAAAEQTPKPGKARHSKKKEAAAAAMTPADSTAASMSASPAKEKHSRKKKAASATESPAPAPTASPAKHSWFSFKKTSPTPAPAMSPAASTGRSSRSKIVSEPTGVPAAGGGHGMVWVNTETHVYHRESSKWYGRTKKGKYMSEQDALKEGNHADKDEKPKS